MELSFLDVSFRCFLNLKDGVFEDGFHAFFLFLVRFRLFPESRFELLPEFTQLSLPAAATAQAPAGLIEIEWARVWLVFFVELPHTGHFVTQSLKLIEDLAGDRAIFLKVSQTGVCDAVEFLVPFNFRASMRGFFEIGQRGVDHT